MKLNDIIDRVNQCNGEIQSLFKVLNYMAMIENVPVEAENLKIEQYNESAFSLIENAFNLLKSRINQLINVCAKYNLVDLTGNRPHVVIFNGANEVEINTLVIFYNRKLNEFENSIFKLQEIFKLNGLVKESN